jgi:RNA polymerase sigma factor (sigma-70 family)
LSKEPVAAVARADPSPHGRSPLRPVGEFEALYRAHVAAITAFFARRSREPQTVADLTAETFVEAVASFRGSAPRPGAERAWLFAIARRVYAKHCEQGSRRLEAALRAGWSRELADDAVEDVLERIDAERQWRETLERLASLSSGEREALELVDIVGLAPREAAEALEISAGALRVRLFRARARMRKEQGDVRI